MKYYLYILKSTIIDKYYTGISQNPTLRLEYHNTFEKGFTARYRPWQIVFTKEFENKENASVIEKKIKSWKSKAMIEKIIKGEINI
jgi:putative endonuclease